VNWSGEFSHPIICNTSFVQEEPFSAPGDQLQTSPGYNAISADKVEVKLRQVAGVVEHFIAILNDFKVQAVTKSNEILRLQQELNRAKSLYHAKFEGVEKRLQEIDQCLAELKVPSLSSFKLLCYSSCIIQEASCCVCGASHLFVHVSIVAESCTPGMYHLDTGQQTWCIFCKAKSSHAQYDAAQISFLYPNRLLDVPTSRSTEVEDRGIAQRIVCDVLQYYISSTDC
jgi:hypothetical protein